jgi:septum formation protein
MQIILASQSPRRKYLLAKMHVDFDVVPSDFVEYFDEKRPVKQVAEELALGKAMDVARKYPDAIVIGSDSIVVLDNRQLGKPENAGVAKAMLRAYRNRSNQVITSVAVVCINKGYQSVESDVCTIYFDGLDEEFIEEYVATATMYDKAGAYAIQHPLVRPHVHKIVGRMDTIIGFPTHIVAASLRELGVEASEVDMSDSDLFEEEGFFK